MKIAQIVCVYPPYRGGIGKVAKDNTDFLISRGHEVTVFTPIQNTQEPQGDSVEPLKPIIKMGNASVMPQLLYKLSGFEIVFLHYPFFGTAEIVFFLKLVFRKKFKLVVEYHMDTLDLGWVKKIFSLPGVMMRKKLFAVADLVIVSSLDYVKTSQIKESYFENQNKFLEIPFSVDYEFFHPSQTKKDQPVQILFVGGMDKAHHFKGVDILLGAFSDLKSDDVVLNLVGNGSLVSGYKQIAEKLGIANKVNFYSNLNDSELAEQYRLADIFVLPSVSRHEAFGIVLLEAMSSGLPVIASNLPGVRTVFENNVQGLLVKPGDKKSLNEALETLIFDKNRRLEMGQKSRELAIKKYSVSINNNDLEKALLNIIKK